MCHSPRVVPHTIYLHTWSGFEAAKTAPWPSRGLHHCGKFLELSDEWAGWGCYCFLMQWHSWAFLAGQEWCRETCRAQIFIFSFNTFDVSQTFWQQVVQLRPKYSYCTLLKWFCLVSVCWVLSNALCSMPWMFSGFYCAQLCHQYLAPYAMLSSKYI